MNRSTLAFILLSFGVFVAAVFAVAFDLPKWFPFNQENSLAEWQEKVFRGKVLYQVNQTDDGGYLSAISDKACSGLFYKIKFNVEDNPMISWKWMVTQFPHKEDSTEPISDQDGWFEKDDYAARVYVIFSSWNFLSTKSLEYVWDESLPEGTVMVSPFLDNIRLVIAESGSANMNSWVAEEHDIYADFIKAFGKEPPKYATAVALMTDSDNTISTAGAFYKEIRIGYAK